MNACIEFRENNLFMISNQTIKDLLDSLSLGQIGLKIEFMIIFLLQKI